MKNNAFTKYRLAGLTLLLIWVAMWVLNWLTPEGGDDYAYKFVLVNNNFDASYPIKSLKDIVISQYNHYLGFNGRCIVHTIVQLFTGILGKSVFNIFNAAIFIVFVCLVTRLSAKITALNLLFAFSVTLLLYQPFGETCLWMTGSVNYLWSATAVCAVLLAVRETKKLFRCRGVYSMILLGVLAGWTHEAMTMPLAVSLAVWSAVNYKSVCRYDSFPLIVGFIIGACICSFAPGTIGRAAASNGINMTDILQRVAIGLRVCIRLKAFYVLILAIVVSCFAEKETFLHRIKKFYADNIIVCNALILAFSIVFVSRETSARVGAGVEFFSIILLLRMVEGADIKYKILLKRTVCVVGTVFFCPIVFWQAKSWADNRYIEGQMMDKNKDIIVIKEWYAPGFETYINQKLDVKSAVYPENSYNIYMAAVYGRSSLAFVSEAIYMDILSGSDRLRDIARQRDYPYYVLPFDEANRGRLPVFKLAPTEQSRMSLTLRIAKRIPAIADMLLLNKTEEPVWQWHIFNIEGRDYIFMNKSHLVDDRVKEIFFQ